MDLINYRLQKQNNQAEIKAYRVLCLRCLQPEFGCYCEHVQSFDPKIKFVILIHPIEVKRRIATGRMSHLVLKNSLLITGQDYSQNQAVNDIINNPKYDPVVLYPGPQALNISNLDASEKEKIFKSDREPVIFVIDGTWNTARKTMWQSQNLRALPKICFTPEHLSQFRVRKQPDPHCFSTIEAIHHTIELMGTSQGFKPETREHDKLIFVFNKMVERQLEFIRLSHEDPTRSHYRYRHWKMA